MRRESHAAMRKRQLAQLDMSPGLAAPATLQACAAVLAGPPETVTSSSFEELPAAPRCYMHGALAGDGAAPLAAGAEGEGGVRAREAAMEAAMRLYADHAPRDRTLRSQRGDFVCRPEQAAAAGGAAG